MINRNFFLIMFIFSKIICNDVHRLKKSEPEPSEPRLQKGVSLRLSLDPKPRA